MKIKEIDRTANVAWSPAQVDPIYLAVGTAAQQLDSSFSTNSTLELYHFDVNQSGLDLPVKATLPCESRFHKLIWGSHGISGDGGGEHPMGVIVGGCDNGVMEVYDASKILKNENPLIFSKNKHAGAVRALDFNPFRPNLVASGASDSEIFIWDLSSPKTPMTPGTKVQPADDVSHVAWNKQVEHILASTFSTRCVVWDLRKNEPVIKVSDTTSRIRYKVLEWHPEVATQMCLASEDDNSPVIQLWDLRYATAPLKVMQGHQRGILGMAWCSQEPDLLLSCGKEARILCWNPNYPHPGYEMVCEIPTSSQYSFDVSFCPKNPIVIASSSYDGRVSIFGISGGVQHPVTSSKLADSFPGMDMALSAPLPSQQPVFLQLRDAPRWLKRPCGASFAFGGKLISFTNTKTPSSQPGHPPTVTSVVHIQQLITLPNLIERSKKLDETLQSGSLELYCAQKAMESGDSSEAQIWDFLQANFSQNPRQEYLGKLGFNAADILAKLDQESNPPMNGLVDDFANLGRGAPDGYANGFDFVTGNVEPNTELKVPADDSTVDGKINQALLCGSIEVAVNLCLDDERWTDALLLASKCSSETLLKVQNKYFQKCQNEATQMIRSVVTHDLSKLVERCSLDSWKQVLAVITTYADQKEFPILADMLGQRLQTSNVESQKLGALLCCICSGNLNHLVDVWVSDSGKRVKDRETPDELQDLVEQVMILKKAGEVWGRDANIDEGPLASKLVQYANLLASQGCLELALSFLVESNDPGIEGLKERLYYSLRCTRPNKVQRNTRSRQSSESSNVRSSLSKRPSYPNAGSSLGSAVFSSSEFSNLSGPVHPPAPPGYGVQQQQPYGNVYVNSNVPPVVGQFTPPMANTAPTNYAPVGPPSTASSSIYNPAEVPVNTIMPPAKEPVKRTPLGSLPQPPVSSAAHGWNDPPQIKSLNKPKLPSTTSASTMQPITHPLFGVAPSEPQETYGSNTFGNATPFPPPSQSFYNPSAAAPSYSQGPGLPPPPSSNTYGNPTTMPPPPQSYNPASAPSSYGQVKGLPPPPSQNTYGNTTAMPPTSQSFYNASAAAPPPFGKVTGAGLPPPPLPSNTYGNTTTMTPLPPQSYNPASAPSSYGQVKGPGLPPPPSSSSNSYGNITSMPQTSQSFHNPASAPTSFGQAPGTGLPPPPSQNTYGNTTPIIPPQSFYNPASAPASYGQVTGMGVPPHN